MSDITEDDFRYIGEPPYTTRTAAMDKSASDEMGTPGQLPIHGHEPRPSTTFPLLAYIVHPPLSRSDVDRMSSFKGTGVPG